MSGLSILVILMMICALCAFGLRSYKKSLLAFWAQTGILIAIFYTLASTYEASELYSWAKFAFLSKFLLIPAIIYFLISYAGFENEDEPIGGFFISPFITLVLSLAFAVALANVFANFALIKDQIALIGGGFVFMVGIFGFIFRKSFVKQILAYCTFENGIHLTLALTAYDAHELVELGIMTDAIFAVIIMVALAFRFNRVFNTLDTTKATDLRG